MGSQSLVPPAALPSCLTLRLSEKCSNLTLYNKYKNNQQQNEGLTRKNSLRILRLKLTEGRNVHILEGQTLFQQHSASGWR